MQAGTLIIVYVLTCVTLQFIGFLSVGWSIINAGFGDDVPSFVLGVYGSRLAHRRKDRGMAASSHGLRCRH